MNRSLLLLCAALPLLACRPRPEARAPEATLTASQLFSEYKADEKAAHAKYLGKWIEVSGTVERTGQDSAGQRFIELKGEEGAGNVQCFILRDHPDASAEIARGQTVALRGAALNRVTHVALDNCVLVKKS